MKIPAHPILSCAEARELEAKLFAGDEAKEWPAMQRAGRAVAEAVLRDFEEIGGFPADGRILVLAGKGHNGGDALIAARVLLEKFPAATAEVIFVFGERALRPLAARAWRELAQSARERVSCGTGVSPGLAENHGRDARATSYALCLDGIFGFQFRAPAPAHVSDLLKRVNELAVRLRAAVDLPSGLGETSRRGDAVFRADFTYATGVVKDLVVNGQNGDCVGRLRYLDLGFFGDEENNARLGILTPRVLAPLAGLRAPESDKRGYGHLFVVGGSRSYPGAVLMSVLAALRSGAGLVTAFVPESLVPAFAARAPEAMWVGWPETPSGGLALEGQHLLRERVERATVLLMGPGLGREAETVALVAGLVKDAAIPLVLDADALQPEIVRAGAAPRVLTPHLGELRRILAGDDFYQTAVAHQTVMVVKGRLTAVVQGGKHGFYSPFGGPVLARGGSGDLLAGLIGGLAAQTPRDLRLAACRGVVWHGRAADLLARARGQVAVHTTELLDFLPAALRECAACPAS
ncbi:MAG TPA: NAD(P)H-hydrate dehydratase [Opitutaceae bacterium]|nr:NAD(P)H-hydrate dehydratase [Opitutaceae bacterium]